jgi:methylenetetrahydrofolate dehydrogenase (NADP+)/methenyltetrahydrofolate cyclohydrolase
MTKIFAGKLQAERELLALKKKVEKLAWAPKVVTLCFVEDSGSVFYTKEKMKAAEKVGLSFGVEWLSFATPVEKVIEIVKRLAKDEETVGIMVQKPMKKSYLEYFLSLGKTAVIPFGRWWEEIRENIDEAKDVDGLSLKTREKIKVGQERVLPATVMAVLKAVAASGVEKSKTLIIGRSDLLGLPLYYYWQRRGWRVELMGRSQLEQQLSLPEKLREYDLIVSVTGVANLIKGEMIKSGVVLIDAGWPKGDVDFASCRGRAAFITPVPGGVGPLTVVSLLENVVTLAILSELDSDFK